MQLGLGLGLTLRRAGGGAGGGAAAEPTATYWRTRFFSSGGEVTLSRLSLRATSGGADLIPSASSATPGLTPQGGLPVSNLSDGNANTFWGNPTSNQNASIVWVWASAVAITEVVAACRNDGFYTQAPTTINVDYSLDSGSTWIPYIMVPAITWTGAGNTQTFTMITGSSFTGYGVRWTASQSGGGGKIAEFVVSTSTGGAQALTGGTAIARTADGTNTAANAFDGDTGTYYASSDGSFPHFLGYKSLGAAVTAYQFSIRAVTGDLGRAPGTASEFGGSNDGITYKVLKQFSPTDWTVTNPQTFVL